jgi:hypothetical protein
MKQTRTTLPVVALALLLVVALLVWLAGDFGATRRNGADDARGESAVAPKEDVESSDLAAEILEQAATTRRAIDAQAVDVGAQGVPTVAEEAPTSARDSRVVVRVTVADNPWLESAWKGRLAWRDALGGDDTVDVVYGYLKLPREPRSSDQFSDLDFTGLAARPLGLTRLDEVDDPDDLEIAAAFELATELVPGARLVWAPSVPSGERTAVRVVLGTPQPPSTSTSNNSDHNEGLVDEAVEVELPFVLPRVVAPISLWVGAPGRQWRSYLLNADDTRIDVLLTPAAAIRVLHDGAPGEVVAVAMHNGMETVAQIEGAQPLEIGDLLTGDHRVWIRPSRGDEPLPSWVDPDTLDDAQSRIARVTLVAGETTEIDLRAASILADRGGVRVIVPALRGDDSVRPITAEPSIWRNATATTKRTHCPPLRLTSKSEEGRTYELLGLAPGRYTAFVETFAARAEFDVVPGVVTDVEVALDCIGYVRFEWPRELVRNISFPSLVPQGDASGREVLPLRPNSRELVAVVCGTYSLRALALGSAGDLGLVSDPFVVDPGATTVVTVRAEPVHHVVVTAVDASTDAPIVLDIAFWVAIDARDVATDAEVVGRILPLGAKGAHTAVEWTLHPHADPVRFIVPEHPLWTFEPLEPCVLEDGATITLRATAR